MTYTVYKHTSPSGKVYIGITSQKPEYRWDSGRGYRFNNYFYRAIEKYGWDNFQHEILHTGLTKDEACAKEIELIAQYKSFDVNFGYNLSTGGEHPGNGRIVSEEVRKKLSESNKGQIRSEETRKKMSEKAKLRTGENHPFYGKRHNELSRQKMSKAHQGKVLSEEHREKMSKSHINHPHLSKKVAQYTLNGKLVQEYPSLSEAARIVGCRSSDICSVCRGKRNTAHGFVWKYVD